MTARILLLIMIGTMGTILLAACGGEEEAEPTPRAATQERKEPAPEATPDPIDMGSETGSTAPSGFVPVEEQLRIQVEIPEYYPEDGPVYPGVNPSQAQQFPNGKVSLIFGTEAMADEAFNVMLDAAEAKGWTIVGQDPVDRGQLARAEKDGRDLMILTNRMEGGDSDPVTIVAVSIEP